LVSVKNSRNRSSTTIAFQQSLGSGLEQPLNIEETRLTLSQAMALSGGAHRTQQFADLQHVPVARRMLIALLDQNLRVYLHNVSQDGTAG
jgi:hypothetical protein